MIVRVWQARTEAAERYRRVFEEEVLEGLRKVEGFRGAYLLARQDGDTMEIRTLTLFDNLDAIKTFAGDEYGREQVTAAARATLLDSDPVVRHFDVLTTVD